MGSSLREEAQRLGRLEKGEGKEWGSEGSETKTWNCVPWNGRRVAWLEVLRGEVIRLKASWAKAL